MNCLWGRKTAFFIAGMLLFSLCITGMANATAITGTSDLISEAQDLSKSFDEKLALLRTACVYGNTVGMTNMSEWLLENTAYSERITLSRSDSPQTITEELYVCLIEGLIAQGSSEEAESILNNLLNASDIQFTDDGLRYLHLLQGTLCYSKGQYNEAYQLLKTTFHQPLNQRYGYDAGILYHSAFVACYNMLYYPLLNHIEAVYAPIPLDDIEDVLYILQYFPDRYFDANESQERYWRALIQMGVGELDEALVSLDSLLEAPDAMTEELLIRCYYAKAKALYFKGSEANKEESRRFINKVRELLSSEYDMLWLDFNVWLASVSFAEHQRDELASAVSAIVDDPLYSNSDDSTVQAAVERLKITMSEFDKQNEPCSSQDRFTRIP